MVLHESAVLLDAHCDQLLTTQETPELSQSGRDMLSSANTTTPTMTSQRERLHQALLLHGFQDFLFHLAMEGLALVHTQMFVSIPTLSRLRGGWRSLSNISNKTLICHQPLYTTAKNNNFAQPLIRTLSKGLIKTLNGIHSGSVTHAPVFKAKCPYNKITLL